MTRDQDDVDQNVVKSFCRIVCRLGRKRLYSGWEHNIYEELKKIRLGKDKRAQDVQKVSMSICDTNARLFMLTKTPQLAAVQN